MNRLFHRISFRFSSGRKTGHSIAFFGSDAFAFPVLRRLSELKQQNTDIVSHLEVITHFKTSKSKKSVNQVEKYANEQNIPISTPIGMTPDNRKNEWQQFSESSTVSQCDLGIVCSYGYMIPSYVIDKFAKGMLVIHPSLLPKYRGASPLQYALLNGDKETGTSVIEISKLKFDAGRILHCSRFTIPENFVYSDLSAALAELSSEAIAEVLTNFEEKKKNAIEQNEAEYTKAPKFDVKDVILDFSQGDADQIYNRFRCFKGTNFVSVKTKFNDKEVIIDSMSKASSQAELDQLNQLVNSQPGSIWAFKQKALKNFIYVKCKQGFIRIDDLRFVDQSTRPAYKFSNQFMDKDQIANDLQHTGHLFFGSITHPSN